MVTEGPQTLALHPPPQIIPKTSSLTLPACAENAVAAMLRIPALLCFENVSGVLQRHLRRPAKRAAPLAGANAKAGFKTLTK